MALSSARGAHFENAALVCVRCPILMELPKTIIFWRADLALWPQNGALACAVCAFVRLASAACSFLTRPPFSVSKMVLSHARRALFRNGALACAGCAFLETAFSPRRGVHLTKSVFQRPPSSFGVSTSRSGLKMVLSPGRRARLCVSPRPRAHLWPVRHFRFQQWCSRLHGVLFSETVLSPAPGARFWKPRSRLDGACI